MTSTDWNAWRPPGRYPIDIDSKHLQSVPFFIKNTVLRFLQIVYAQRSSGDFHYDPDEERTEIKIADQDAFQLHASENKPGIVTVRGPIRWGNLGMTQNMQSMDILTGVTAKSDILYGAVGISCISRVGLEAELIASDVFNLIKFFRSTLMKFGFFSVSSMELGPEQLIEVEGEPKLFLVSVQMQCQVQDRWLLEPKSAAELKQVVLTGLAEIKKDNGVEY